MATSAAAALLDELMGKHRNALPNEKPKELKWDDPEVCQHYLVKFCPNELFVNTKADLGPCQKLHDDELKRAFQKSVSYKKQVLIEEFIKFCQDMLTDVERRIKKGKQRLSLVQNEDMQALTPGQKKGNEEKVLMLTEKINSLVNEAEKLGINGNVEEAQGILKLCDQLKEEREVLKQRSETSRWLATAEIALGQEKQMEVCEVCGAFLIVGDAQQRIDDHLMGKQHMGYAKLRSALEEIQVEKQSLREERERQREKEREERKKHIEEEEKRKKKEIELDRNRHRDIRHHGDKSNRERHKDRRPNSHAHKNNNRSRSRDRNKDRYKDRELDKYQHRDHRKRHKREGKDGKSDHKSGSNAQGYNYQGNPASNGLDHD